MATVDEALREVTIREQVASAKTLIPADAGYFRILASYGSRLVSARWLCAYADRIDATIAISEPLRSAGEAIVSGWTEKDGVCRYCVVHFHIGADGLCPICALRKVLAKEKQ